MSRTVKNYCAAADMGGFDQEFAREVLLGLSAREKSIPSRFLYDARGSELFEEITRLPEYYPTRTEIAMLEQHAPAMAARTKAGAALIEFGSGSSRKTEILLEQLDDLSVYVPLDVSRSALNEASERLSGLFPELRVVPVVGNFSGDIDLPAAAADAPKLGFFPGSTIGNLTHDEARDLLAQFGNTLAPDGRLIIGVDLKKDENTLNAAYNDADGVTADFNLNLLTRINRELGATFDFSGFKHVAEYNPEAGRVELYLESKRRQRVRLLGRNFTFAANERIHTENSHKYTVGEFQDLAALAGWHAVDTWTDDNELFSIHDLQRAA